MSAHHDDRLNISKKDMEFTMLMRAMIEPAVNKTWNDG
jgi:hypothetical protein